MSATLETISQNRPLTREQEAALARRIQQGDEQARQELADSNKGLAYTIIKKYIPRSHQDFDYYWNLVEYKLYVAAGKFDPDKGYRFSTLTGKYVKNELMKEFNQKKGITTVNLNPEDEDDGPLSNPMDIFFHNDGDPYEAVEKNDLIKYAFQLLKGLDARSQTILRGIFLEDLTLRQMAKLLGVSYQRVRQLQNLALKKLRKKLEGGGIEVKI